MNRFILSVIFSLAVCTVWSQGVFQTVKGSIKDRLTMNSLAGANVKISNLNDTANASTDDSGNFKIENVPAGRYRIQVSFTGYRSYDDELLVISGRETVLQIMLGESTIILNAVEVEAGDGETEKVPGIRTFSIEKTMRIPANFFDPVRMATTYPGVVAANDQANAIIVRGNSPNGLLWRLNGLDIVNPNHLSNAGTLSDKPMANGGGVNILSAQMLDRTNFYTGAFPVRFGNALSGVIDMKLREGNHDKMEYTAQASLIGLDVAAEGPINQNHNTSFLANYRYSTVGLLSKMGIDFGGEVIDFQDFSFNLNKQTTQGASLSLFGFGGLSSNVFKEKQLTEWKEDKDHNNINYDSKTLAVGLNYTKPFKHSSFVFSLGYSGNTQDRDLNASSLIPVTDIYLATQHYASSRNLMSSHAYFEHKVGGKNYWQVGVITDYVTDQVTASQAINKLGTSDVVNGKAEGVLLQPYASLNLTLATPLDFEAGLRYVAYSYNGSRSWEPRMLLNYHPSPNHSFELSYGLVSQLQLPTTYFASGNKDLGFTRAHHVNLSYRQAISQTIRLTSGIYYQQLFDVPVERTASSFSAVNLLETFAPGNLVNRGHAENYGMDLSVEKSFYHSNYFIIGGSYYESAYKGSDDVKHNTRFNGKFTVNAVYGKEWKRSKKNSIIGLNTRLLYLGGMRETPVDVVASQAVGETRRDETKPFENQLSDYFRIDLRLSFRKNNPRYTRTFAIDLQNVTGQQNEAYHYYDFTQAKVVTKYQLGLIPVIVYRVDF